MQEAMFDESAPNFTLSLDPGSRRVNTMLGVGRQTLIRSVAGKEMLMHSSRIFLAPLSEGVF